LGLRRRIAIAFGLVALTNCNPSPRAERGVSNCAIELIVLGIGQDAGAPQIGNPQDPAWKDPSLKMSATSIALVDHVRNRRYLFEATPHITEQIQLLDELAPGEAAGLNVDGVFLTHAHIGHYAGLIYFGREAAGAKNIPVYLMPRFASYLQDNGPWSQLVALNNIEPRLIKQRQAVVLSQDIRVTPYLVPHRDEYSETVAYKIETPEKSALFVPDIDSWGKWEDVFGISLSNMVNAVDYAFLDATFFDDNELPGRDMSLIPHPRVTDTMDLLQEFPEETRAGVNFIHINHTNPIRYEGSPETQEVLERGYNIAREGQRNCLAK